jgi:hypothetical protein
MVTDYTQNIRYLLRKGTSDDPFVPIVENIVIKNNKAQLTEVPNYTQHVTIPSYYEVFKTTYNSTFILNNNEFWVDYNIGVIYFNSSEEGKTINNVSYNGTGRILYPSDRIFLQNDNPNVIETLQDFIDNALQRTSDFDSILNDFKPMGEYNNTVQYKKYNTVNYDGQLWLCIQDSLGNVPVYGSQYWSALSYAKEQGDYAKAQGDYAKLEGDNLANAINQFNYINEYDNITNYQPKNMVQYHGSTYVNKVACQGIIPTNITYWQIIATGYVIKGDYDSNQSYEERDIVYYGIEKTLYKCIQAAGTGISPYNISYWEPILDAEDMISQINDYTNDTTSLYISHDNEITITHNLNTYPLPLVYSLEGAGYGNAGYGENSYGGGIIYQILAKSEYPDANNIKLYLNEQFNGTSTITSLSSTKYQIDFSNDISIIVELK